jgi:GH25 family lysozyme M1 (1,4-beta-N-acetylmuramidase)
MALYGVDVSQFQGTINWDQLNVASNFAIMRCAYGTLTDPQFARNQSEARRVRSTAGPLGIGYYYFAYPTLLDSIVSANYFVSALGPLQAGEVLALDLEGNVGSNPVAWSLAWLRQVEALTGVKPLIYLNQSEVAGYDWSAVVENGNGIWLAKYDGVKGVTGTAGPWPFIACKQWTDADAVAGISGKVDGDVFNGTFDQFYAYGYHGVASSPPTIPTPVPMPTPIPTPTAAPTPPAPVPTPTTTTPTSPSPITKTTPSLWQNFKAWLKRVLGQ